MAAVAEDAKNIGGSHASMIHVELDECVGTERIVCLPTVCGEM